MFSFLFSLKWGVPILADSNENIGIYTQNRMRVVLALVRAETALGVIWQGYHLVARVTYLLLESHFGQMREK